MIDPETGIQAEAEPEVLMARRGFPKAQELLGGVALSRVGNAMPVGWHDSTLHPESPAFCLVKKGSTHEDLLGEILIFTYGQLTPVFAYCVSTADIDEELSLARRSFQALSRLSLSSILCDVDIRQ